jgi:hypothetical protein
MATAWKGLRQRLKSKGSKTAVAVGLREEDEDILHLCDSCVVNDLKEEYYYSQNDIALDAFEAHLRIVEKDPQKYVTTISTMRPIMLEAHKVIAALYLWTRKLDRKLALDLLTEVRPTWRMTFFSAMASAPTYAKLNHKWNRTSRALFRKMVDDADPFFVMKYAAKLKPLVAKAHLKEDPKTAWLFKRRRIAIHPTLETVPIYRDYIRLVKIVRSQDKDQIIATLETSSLPYTVALGLLGKWSKDPDVASRLILLMTQWETILSLKKLENSSLNLSEPKILERIESKLNSVNLERMKIDPVELFQAHNQVQNGSIKRLLARLISTQIDAIGTALKSGLGDRKVCVVFDCSGSMRKVAEWSMMLAYAIGKNLPNSRTIVFSNKPHEIPLGSNFIETLSWLTSHGGELGLWQGTALGKALLRSLEYRPDLVFFISDFEGNIKPWSDEVYREYTRKYGTFPTLISIKATASPRTAIGEMAAVRTKRWLGIPEEYTFTVRNLWDLPRIMEYLFNLLPLLKKRGMIEKVPAYVT